jgi:hypothetical protein
MSYNIINVIRDIVTGELKLSTPEQVRVRRNVCSVCEARSALNVCTACGCFLPAKIRVEKSECPMDLW